MKDIVSEKIYIYVITNTLNNKNYVGQTNNPTRRFKFHNSKSNIKYKSNNLYKDIYLYGSDVFKFEIIEIASSRQEAHESEIFYIQLFQTLEPNGYNLSRGGNNSSPTESTRIKIRKTLKDKVSNLNVSKKGKDHPRYGWKHTKEVRDRINKKISGANCTSCKINLEKVIYIYSLAYLGLSPRQIIMLCDEIKLSAIHNIINKRSWKDDLSKFVDIENKPTGHAGYKDRLKLVDEIKNGNFVVNLPPLK